MNSELVAHHVQTPDRIQLRTTTYRPHAHGWTGGDGKNMLLPSAFKWARKAALASYENKWERGTYKLDWRHFDPFSFNWLQEDLL